MTEFWVLSWATGYFRQHDTHGPWATRALAVEWANEVLQPDVPWTVVSAEPEEADADEC